MKSTSIKSLHLSAALVACLLAGAAHGQTPWDSLKTKLKGIGEAKTTTARVVDYDKQGNAVSAPAAAAQAPGAVPSVPNENPESFGARLRVNTPGVANAPQAAGEPTILSSDPNAGGLAAVKDGKIALGRESDEPENEMATNLFKNPDMRRLLGDEPRFVYDPKEKQDPMVVPWVRRAAIFSELMATADALLKENKTDDAIKIYQRVVAMRDPRFASLVQEKISKLDSARMQAAQQALEIDTKAVVAAKPELPGWVHDNTTGAIVTPGSAVCLVGDEMLHVGETVKAYPEVKVKSISSSTVVFEVKDAAFEVPLAKEEENKDNPAAPSAKARK